MISVRFVLLSLLCIVLSAARPAPAAEPVFHDLQVRLQPDRHELTVRDTVRLPAQPGRRSWRFRLHAGLRVQVLSPGMRLEEIERRRTTADAALNTSGTADAVETRTYRLHLGTGAAGNVEVVLHYQGTIHHPVREEAPQYARSFGETPGLIEERGVYLAGSSYWVPASGEELVTFRLGCELPSGWYALSQGSEQEGGAGRSRWECRQPMEEIYLTAAPWHIYRRRHGSVEFMALLRAADDALAARYLDVTGHYLEMYEKLVGAYPFTKFALVENFWETGYGMPSFTLLGPQIIRFPFILHSSYPHELLHNWWGNGVFVEYGRGNWCEGLTAYLADHLIAEQRGQGAEYRRDTLQGYADYVRRGRDFPLTLFRARRDAASSAIGYGKGLMFFHMLRRTLGDEAFRRGLQNLYRDNSFRRADFADLCRAFSAAAGRDLRPFFRQWTTRVGAPELLLDAVRVESGKTEHRLRFTLRQLQKSASFDLAVPVAVWLEGESAARVLECRLQGRRSDFSFSLPRPPRLVQVDPQFDLFRRPAAGEVPATLSRMFGAERVLIVLPQEESPELREGYRALAAAWAGDRAGRAALEVRGDGEITRLPGDRAVWIFGRGNRFFPEIARRLRARGIAIDDAALRVDGKEHSFSASSIVAVCADLPGPGQTAALLGTDRAAALPGLGRKLPHYGKYSWLAFSGDEPTNTAKGQWPAGASPLRRELRPGGATELPARRALADPPAPFSAEGMMADVRALADPRKGGRGPGSTGLAEAAEYIARRFRDCGLAPAGEAGGYFQAWRTPPPGGGESLERRNVIAELPGSDPALRDRPLIVCAHYDHLGPDPAGRPRPGADDNASGVALMLALAARMTVAEKSARPVRFIAFDGEEQGMLGASHYLETLPAAERQTLMAVVNLDGVGRLGARKPLVIGGGSAREWKFIFMGAGYTTGLESDLAAENLRSGDQAVFIDRGIPAIQISGGPHEDYHLAGDTADKIEIAGMGRIAAVAWEVVTYLADRSEPLTTETQPTTPVAPSGGERKVKTGLTPDFTYPGPGVRASAVAPGSAAEKAGLQVGDIIVRIGDTAIDNLAGYAAALKTLAPGATMRLTCRRADQEIVLTVTLEGR